MLYILFKSKISHKKRLKKDTQIRQIENKEQQVFLTQPYQ